MERRRYDIQDIRIDDKRMRGANMAKVAEIAKSISEIGLMNPPAVRIVPSMIIDGEEWTHVPVLIYGRHRLLAMQSLGHEVVECTVHDVDDLHAELMEIDENLARAGLSHAQETAHILRRQEIWLQINKTGETNCSTSLSDGRGAGPQHKKQFAAEVAELTGASKVDINRKIRRARDIGPDIYRIPGTSLDSGVEMEALSKLPAGERESLIARAEAGEKVSARPSHPTKDSKAQQRQMFWDMWAKLDDDVRQELSAVISAQHRAN